MHSEINNAYRKSTTVRNRGNGAFLARREDIERGLKWEKVRQFQAANVRRNKYEYCSQRKDPIVLVEDDDLRVLPWPIAAEALLIACVVQVKLAAEVVDQAWVQSESGS